MSESQTLPLAVTMGEPAGVGGEITLKAWQELRREGPRFFVIDDAVRLARLARALGMVVPLVSIREPHEALRAFGSALPVLPVRQTILTDAGQFDKQNAAAVVRSIDLAVGFAQSGAAGGIVTNPIHKSALYDAGFTYPGHTEYLASKSRRAGPVVMMLACPQLRVVPVTIHVALKQALQALTTEGIVAQARATAAALRTDFGIARPRLAIAGLNPHAGEGGAMGREEIDIIAPAIEQLTRDGIEVSGPWPPDTMFSARARTRYDAAICMYHDQALIPLKTLDVDGGVNITLGLDFVRTSPDHGTAIDIAGKGAAHPGSLIAALRTAAEMARVRAAAKGQA